MICFHFTIFVVLETTQQGRIITSHLLWFAFILLSLSYWKQLGGSFTTVTNCCDLLSFYYLCRTGNNFTDFFIFRNCVVICFHFTIFVVLETTRHTVAIWYEPLWFAFILLSLSYWKQHIRVCGGNQIVVICFHFTIFVVLETTRGAGRRNEELLWFAFILLSLSYWKQQNSHYLLYFSTL